MNGQLAFAIKVDVRPARERLNIQRRVRQGVPGGHSQLAVLNFLRAHGPRTASNLAGYFRWRDGGMRKSLCALERRGCVARNGARPNVWRAII